MFSLRRLAAAAATAVALVAALPAPATAAAPTDVPFTLIVPEISFSTTGSVLPLVLSPATSTTPSTLTDVVIEVDAAGLAGIATVSVAGRDCTGRCDLGSLSAATGWRLPDLDVKAKSDAAVGASGTLRVTLSADGYEPISAVATLTVNDVHVYAGPPSATYTVKDGSEQAVPVLQFTSTGVAADAEMAFRIVGDPGLVFDVPREGDLLCWRNTSELRFAERVCDYSRLAITEGSNWQIRLTEMHAPGAEPGDEFRFRATFWVGDGARNVAAALKKQTGLTRSGTRGLTPPTKLPDGSGGPFGSGPSASGTIVVARPPKGEPPASAPATTGPATTPSTTGPTVTPPTTEPATTEPAAPTTGATTPPAAPVENGGSGGSLPTTGANAMIVAGLGAVLIGGGVAAFVIARRRRTRFSA